MTYYALATFMQDDNVILVTHGYVILVNDAWENP